ncbi:MAG: TonB-dependent receptor [Thiomonas sp.]|uniref:Putative Porin n=1 Tax=mine drainage metagenome TaxID=410659 RepID=E6PU96_9ZZZZ
MQHPITPTAHPAFKPSLLAQAMFTALLALPLATAQAQSAPESLGTVQAGGQTNATSEHKPSHEAEKLAPVHVFKSGESVKVLTKSELTAAGPVGGSAQALSYAPGVGVTGYGATGSTKNSISINGIKQGWGGFSGGQIDNGSIAVTFDGVPMANPSTGLWESPEVPQLSLLQGAAITYGPGNASDRWYNNIGGEIAFVPLQPTDKPGGSIGLSVGSYGARNLSINLRTGAHDGWSTILAGGVGSANSYRTSVDGFDNHSHNYAWFLKTRKTFENGDFSLGFYQAQGSGYRPVPIPLQPISGVTLDGTANAPLYSQPTSGYDSSIPANVWFKNDTNKTRLIYGKANINVDASLSLHNLIWYRLGERLHYHYNNYGLSNPGNLYEYNNPSDTVYGDKAWADVKMPYNTVSFGGFFLKSHYNSRNAFYNTNPPYNGSQTVPNAHYRSDYWDQTDLAAFVQDRISPTANLDITPGIRFINYQTSYYPAAQSDFSQAYALYPGNNQGVLPAANVTHHATEPSVAVNWRVNEALALFGNYAVAYKEPQVGGGGGIYQSTPPIYNLEKGTDYNLGVKMHVKNDGVLRNFLLSVSYFHLHYSNQYIPLSDANGNFLGDANGDSIYKGFNIAVADDVLYNLHLFANMNFEQANFNNYTTGGVSYAGLPVSNVPNRTLNVGASYAYYVSGMLLTPRAWYQYVGQQHMFDNNLGAPSQKTIPAYGTFNIGLDGEVPFAHSSLHDVRFSVDVLNVLDKRYNAFEEVTSGGLLGGNSQGQVLGLPGAPRTFYASVNADF